MAKYLLACTCGNRVVVEERQAGGRVACECGAMLDVPPLRKLRHLPQQASADTTVAQPWSVRQAVISLGLIGAVIFTGTAAYFWWTSPTLPQYDPEVNLQVLEQSLQNATPLQAWQLWEGYYKRLGEEGFQEFRAHDADLILAIRQRNQAYALTAAAIAAVSLLVGMAAYALRGDRNRGRARRP